MPQWTGFIEEITPEGYWARIEEEGEGKPAEEVLFLPTDFSVEDRAFLQPGTYISWRIEEEESSLAIIPLPSWTPEELQQAHYWAEEMARWLKGPPDDPIRPRPGGHPSCSEGAG